MSGEQEGLPEGWAKAPLADVADSCLGKMLDRSKHTEGELLPYLRNINVRWGEFDLSDLSEMFFEEGQEERYGLRENDVLICEGGEPGRSAVWQIANTDMRFQKALHRVRPSEVLTPHWLVHSLRHDADAGTLADYFTGTTIKHLTGRSLARYEVTLPPLNEQRRIVAKIESLQARSDAAKEALDAIPPLLEKFRQSVLAAAFRGDLTASWRAKNPDVEPASVLLERIRAERRTRWIADAAEKGRARAEARARKAGKPWTAADDAKVLDKERVKAAKKYKAPEPVDAEQEGLPELPEGWCWARLGELPDLPDNSMTDGPFGSKLKSAHYVDSGVRVVRLGNLGVAEFKNKDKSYISEEHFADLRKHEVFPGDLLIAALAEPVGRCCFVPDDLGTAIVKADCIRFVPHPLIERRYLMHWMNSPPGTRNCERLSHGIGRLRINMANLRAMPVAVAPQSEQLQLVKTVENLFENLNALRNRVECSRSEHASLNQSILAKAFRGELVPQDPTDEPASVLLERIRAEREAAEAAKKAAKKKRGRKGR